MGEELGEVGTLHDAEMTAVGGLVAGCGDGLCHSLGDQRHAGHRGETLGRGARLVGSGLPAPATGWVHAARWRRALVPLAFW